ncbi:YhdH/YhfP family quinone oxidoreductase [Desulfogranum mediterraneum]|uniref:YhdH/YhfP family quinone oxidoreductase n=1 Tax=Desulfogranum mediterraneum TaxID=160661 RepID=UPI000420272C|nr:YhdH/YhfP family quinone oxidoreductase [Desulfogranum mediterraneum]
MENRTYQALIVREEADQRFSRAVESRNTVELPPGDLTIKVRYSSLNYKDALSASGNRGVTRSYPHTPGIDAVGTVVESNRKEFAPGSEVLCTGYDLGMNTPGGFGQYIRVSADWVLARPQGLSALECMQLGTAGFTAAQCVAGLRNNGVFPEKGQVLVTGATGGVGLIAILLLAKLGYEIHALTGKKERQPLLRSLGVTSFAGPGLLDQEPEKLLLPGRWAGVVDTVGGTILANAVKGTDYDGVVASCGNALSGDLPLNVYPFILRGVHLLGIYSANCPMPRRQATWRQLSAEWKLDELATISRVVPLSALDQEIERMLARKSFGRTVVDMEEDA